MMPPDLSLLLQKNTAGISLPMSGVNSNDHSLKSPNSGESNNPVKPPLLSFAEVIPELDKESQNTPNHES